MSNRRRGLLAGVGFILVQSAATAGELSLPVEFARTIDNSGGAHRVLLRVGQLERLDGLAITSAMLTFPSTRVEGDLDQELPLQVFPLTTSWDGTATWESGWERPGGDFDPDLYAREYVRSDQIGEEIAIDLGVILREIQHGSEFHGLILSVAPYRGIGLGEEVLERLPGLSEATVEVTYRGIRVPPTDR